MASVAARSEGVGAMKILVKLAAAAALIAAMNPATLAAQMRTVDPNIAIDSDLSAPRSAPQAPPADTPRYDANTVPAASAPANTPAQPAAVAADPATNATTAAATYKRQDLLSAAEGVFGKGAEGLGALLEKILSEQGEPNAYIAGREASGAFVVGLRYGSGVMSHKIEGDRPVYWTGPSVGFDAGGNASKVFVLVYNLYDTQEIFRRYPEGEGHLYFVGGFSATYLRRGNTVLIPVRLGVGVRAGVNIGYMKFSEKAKWLPF